MSALFCYKFTGFRCRYCCYCPLCTRSIVVVSFSLRVLSLQCICWRCYTLANLDQVVMHTASDCDVAMKGTYVTFRGGGSIGR